jgi:hypothetical protein
MGFKTLSAEWWADAEGNPVPYGSPSGVRVLYAAGAEVPADVADALNGTEGKDIAAPPSDKAVKGPRSRK